MEEFSIILVVAVGITCFVFGLLVLLKDFGSKINYAFYVFTWAMAMWAMIRFAFYTSPTNIFYFREVYAAASLALLTAGPWILYFIREKPKKFLIVYYYLLSVFILTAPLWDYKSMKNPVIKNGIITYEVGFLYYLYIGLVFISVLYIFILLLLELRKLSKNKDGRWYQVLYVTIGYGIFFISEFTYGFVLTSFNLGPSVPVDYFSALIFVPLASFALIKYNRQKKSLNPNNTSLGVG